MINYKFDDIQLNSAFISGEVNVIASTSNRNSTPEWETEDDTFEILWDTLTITAFNSDFTVSASGQLAEDMGMAAVQGYGYAEFKDEMEERILNYIDKHCLWEEK